MVVLEFSGLWVPLHLSHAAGFVWSWEEEGATGAACEQLVAQPTGSLAVAMIVDAGLRSKRFPSGCGGGTDNGAVAGVAWSGGALAGEVQEGLSYFVVENSKELRAVSEASEGKQGVEDDPMKLDSVVFGTSRQVVVVEFPGRIIAMP